MHPVNAFWEAAPAEMAQGYERTAEGWRCLLCGQGFATDEVYPMEGHFYTAEGAVRRHVELAHGAAFQTLCTLDKRYLGLTAHQAQVLRALYDGANDREAAEQTGSSQAAIRNLRFQLREREKQAKAFLALMEAFRTGRAAREAAGQRPLPPPVGATMGDDRFRITAGEEAAALKACFGPDGRLLQFPAREKRKIVVLGHIAQRFETGRRYTEKEVNGLIDFPDHATVRRYLIEYGFLARSQDCSQYWRKEQN